MIKRPGLFDMIAGAWTIATDRGFDRRNGTSTTLSLWKLRKRPERRSPQQTPERIAREALAALPNDREGIFLDVGSGNGRMMILAAELGYRSIVGVEVRESEVTLARRNIDLYRQKSGSGAEFSVAQADAAGFQPPDATRTVFLFNPFGKTTLEQFCQKLLPAAGASNGTLHVVYIFPVYGNVFDDHDGFELQTVGKTRGFPWAVFRAT